MSSFDVYGFHVDWDPSPPIYEKIHTLTSAINKKYCELNGYHYQFDILNKSVLDNFIDDEIFHLASDWHLSCIYKYKCLLDKLEKSADDYIVYVEYDACFCNDFLRLENYIDGEHDIFYSRCNWSFDVNYWIDNLNKLISEINRRQHDIFNYDKYSATLLSEDIQSRLVFFRNIFLGNEGFYIFKNSEISKKFLKAVIKYAPLFYDHTKFMCTETQVVQCVMSKDVFTPHIKVLPPQTQGHIWGNSNRYDEDECLICHNSSIAKDTLYRFLQTIANNKYWSKYKFLSTD